MKAQADVTKDDVTLNLDGLVICIEDILPFFCCTAAVLS